MGRCQVPVNCDFGNRWCCASLFNCKLLLYMLQLNIIPELSSTIIPQCISAAALRQDRFQ